MMNKIFKSAFSILCAFCILFLTFFNSFAETNELSESDFPKTIDTYTLESVETIDLKTQILFDEAQGANFIEKIIGVFNSLFFKIENCKTGGDVIFQNEYEIYEFSGPQKVDETFSIKKSVKKSMRKKLSNNMIEKAVGFSVSDFYNLVSNFKTEVNSKSKIIVKVHTIYKKTSFDIGNRFSGKIAEKGCFVLKPNGLRVSVATYKK